MRLKALIKDMKAALAVSNLDDVRVNPEVVLIVNGIAYPIDQVWWEPRQTGRDGDVGAICVGDDPR